MGQRAPSFALALIAAGCSTGPVSLFVDLKTDLSAPSEFVAVRVTVLDRAETGELASRSTPVFDLEGRFVDGVRVAELSDLSPGDVLVRVELLDPLGEVVVARRVALQLRQAHVLTVVITRSCVGVVCPGPGDPSEASECLAGRCVPPECDTDAPESCGDPECESDADCPAGPTCTVGRCAGGACLLDTDDARCASGERCDVSIGCTSGCDPADCDDGNPCTDDGCSGGECVHTPNDARCDDGVFCNGPDTCSASACTVHEGDPCAAPTVCDEAADGCTGCTTDEDCPAPMDGPWSTCAGFSDDCDELGTRARTVTRFTCVSGECRGAPETEMEECPRDTDGTSCGPGGATCDGGACVCPGGTTESACGNGGDDDCDGAIDCADSDCDGASCGAGRACSGGACVCSGGSSEIECGNGSDDDCDGAIDCADSDCDGASCGAGRACSGGACVCSGGGSEIECGDGIDDDCDGAIDCADSDCDGASCGAGSTCTSGTCTCSGMPSTPLTDGTRAIGGVEVVWNGTEFAVAYMVASGSGYDYELARVSETGAPIATRIPLTTSGAVAQPPHLAWSGSAYGLAWSDTRNLARSNDIYFRTFAADGAPMSAEELVESTPALDVFASIAWGTSPGRFGVAYTSGSGSDLDLRIRPYSATGTALATATTVVDTPAFADTTSTAYVGSAFVVGFHESRSGALHVYVTATDGTAGDPDGEMQIDDGAGPAYLVDLTPASAGAPSVGMVWVDGRHGQDEIYFSLVQIFPPLTIPILPNRRVTNASGTSSAPSIVFNGTRFAVAWHDDRSGSEQIYLRELDVMGVPLASETVLSCAPRARGPSIAWSGSRYGVAWVDFDGPSSRVRFASVAPSVVTP